MNKKTMFNWGIWMGVVMAIYACFYTLTPLASCGVMWATFVAMPIFLTSGGKKEDIVRYSCGGICGVLWGWIFVKAGELVGTTGMPTAVCNMLVTLVITILCVWVHGVLLANTWMNVLPPVFGGMAATIASSFFQTGASHLIPLAITLVCGVLMGYVCMLGLSLMDEKGSWKLPRETKTQKEYNKENVEEV